MVPSSQERRTDPYGYGARLDTIDKRLDVVEPIIDDIKEIKAFMEVASKGFDLFEKMLKAGAKFSILGGLIVAGLATVRMGFVRIEDLLLTDIRNFFK